MGDSDESKSRKRHKPIQPPSPSPENDRNSNRRSSQLQKNQPPPQRDSVFRRLGVPRDNTRPQNHRDRPQQREICRHFKARGYCDFDGKCAFQHPPHLAVKRPPDEKPPPSSSSTSARTAINARRYSPQPSAASVSRRYSPAPQSSTVTTKRYLPSTPSKMTTTKRYSPAPPPASSVRSQALPARKSAPMSSSIKDFRRDNRDRSTTTTWRLNTSQNSSSSCCTNSNAIPVNRNRRTNDNSKFSSSSGIGSSSNNFGQKSTSLQNRPTLKIRRPVVSAQYQQQAIQKRRINRLTMRRPATTTTTTRTSTSTMRNSSSTSMNNRRAISNTVNLPKSYSSNTNPTLDRRRLINTQRKSSPTTTTNIRRNVNYRSSTIGENEKSSNRDQPSRKRFRLNEENQKLSESRNQKLSESRNNRRSTIVNDRSSKFSSISSRSVVTKNRDRDFDADRRREMSRRSPTDNRKTTTTPKESSTKKDKSFSETKSLDTSTDSQRKIKTFKDRQYRQREQSPSEKDSSKGKEENVKLKDKMEKLPRRTSAGSSTLKSLVSVAPPPQVKKSVTPKIDRPKSPSSSRKSSSMEKRSDVVEKKKKIEDSKFQTTTKKSKLIQVEKSSTRSKKDEKDRRPLEKKPKIVEKIDKRKSEERKIETKAKETTKRSSSLEKKEKSPKKSRETSVKKEEIPEPCDLERSLESGEALSSERQDLEPISDEESQETPPAAAITTENLRVDWSALVKHEEKIVQESESVQAEETPIKEPKPRALKRFELANFLPNLRLNKELLGAELSEKIEKIVNEDKRDEDKWNIDSMSHKPTKLSILNNIGQYRKALSARSELQIRRKLCGLYEEPPQHLLTNTSEMGVSFNAEVFNMAKKLMLESKVAVT